MTPCRLLTGLLSAVIACAAAPVPAQPAGDWPARAVKVVVTFPPGGSADITARVFGEKLSEAWKQPVVIENRTGAGGSIGVESVHRSAPDGYTLLLMSNTHLINHVLFRKLSFDITSEFPSLGIVTASPMMIAVHPSVAARNMKELTALFRASPGKLDYGSCNVASPHHFAMEMYKRALGIDAVHVPHRGCGPLSADAAAGHVKVIATNAATALPFVKDGRLRALALLSTGRSASVPDVPTMRESGIEELKDFALDNYYGLMASPGTPSGIVARIDADLRRVAQNAELRKRLEQAGFDMFVLTSAEMQKLIRADAERYGQIARRAGISIE